MRSTWQESDIFGGRASLRSSCCSSCPQERWGRQDALCPELDEMHEVTLRQSVANYNLMKENSELRPHLSKWLCFFKMSSHLSIVLPLPEFFSFCFHLAGVFIFHLSSRNMHTVALKMTTVTFGSTVSSIHKLDLTRTARQSRMFLCQR